VSSDLRIDGTSIVTGDAGSQAYQGIGMGHNGNEDGNSWGSKISEWIMYDKLLSADEITQVQNYLSDKWGFGADCFPPINAYTNNVDIEVVGDAARFTGTVNVIEGIKANLTSIVLIVNGTVINTNSTVQNGTAPYSTNIGPLWYQMITGNIYEFEIETHTQNSSGTFTNSSLFYDSREYDPDYFTALDPTQGTVNYTFSGNFISVNRDTNSVVFNIECRYLSQSEAFLNDPTGGVWDNETNTLFFVSDTSGHSYVECFNDGELFVTAIQQNFTNALVPGLVIFDQLGGFFGAPSIILVIISILSLGTGRNYPIIMLIAAAVTGILLALELLTLDPGLVVAIIVMTGFGLFGIRKFY
jgi:hypothetical protein